jgi:hypothetical protein
LPGNAQLVDMPIRRGLSYGASRELRQLETSAALGRATGG